MKTPRILRHSIATLLSLAAAASAQTVYTWDADPVTPGIQDGSGNWDLLTQNWVNGGVNSLWVNAPVGLAIFGSGAGGTVTVGAITVDDLTFNNAYTLTGGTLTLSGTPTITVAALQSATIDSEIAGAGWTRLGTGTLTLNGAVSNTYAGTAIIDNGTTILGKTGGAVAITGAVQMGSGVAGNQPNLRMAANEQFASGVVMTFVNPSGSFPRFDLQGTTQMLAGIQGTTGAGVIQNERIGGGGAAAAGTLTINNGADFSYNGYLRDEDDGGHVFKLNLVKDGVGTQILSGVNIAYQGTTTVLGGTLELQATPNFASAATVNGGTLKLNNSATLTGTAFTVNLAAAGTLNFTTTNTTVDANRFSGAITGTGTIVKEGAGWYHIQGGAMANFAGTINVMQGRWGNASNTSVWTNSTADAFVASGAELDIRTDEMILDQLTGTGSVVNTYFLGETNTLTVGVANGSSVFDGVITGAQSGANNTSISAGRTGLTKTGTGSFTVTNAGSNYVGPTTVNNGLLVLQSTRLVAGDKIANGSGILEINSEVPFVTRWNNGGAISGNGTINKTGTGVFGTINAVNFSGTINILDGRIHNDNVTGNWGGSTADVNISATGVLDLRANDMYVDELNGTGEIWNSHPAGGGDTLFVGVANGSSSYDGIIMGNASQGADNPNGAVLSLTKQGTGTFTITGGSNIYSGATTVNNGVLRISGGDDRLPLVTNLTVNGGAAFGGTFDLNGLNQTVGGISGAAGAVAGVITSTTGPATITANVAGANVFTTAANIADTGGNVVSLTKSGTGAQGLAGTNTYSGPTLVLAGALRAESASPFSPNSNIQLGGGVIEAGFADLAVTTGTGGGQVQWVGDGGFSAAGAPRNITVDGGGTLTWNSGSFVPAGSRLLLGSATANNTATLTNALDLAGDTGTVEVISGPALIEGALGGTISNGTLNVRGNQGTLALTGQATADVVVDNTLTASTNIMNLLLNRSGGNAIAGGLQIGATDNGQFATVRLGSSDQIADTSTVSFGAVAGSWSYLNLYGFNETIAGLSSIPGKDGGVVQLVESDASPVTNSTLTLNVPGGTQTYLGHVRDRGSGASTDPGGNGRLGFAKEGVGTQEITTWNTQVWTGATAVNDGTLRIALGGVVAGNAVLASSTNIALAATLDFTNAANGNMWTYAGALTGDGPLVKSGIGIVTLTGAGLTNTGPTNVNSGILRLLDTTYASATTVSAGAYVEEFRSAGSGVLAASMSGAGGFIKNGDGETTLTGAHGVAQTVVRRGTLTLAGDNLLPTTGTVAISGHLTPTLKLNGTTQTVGGLAASRDVNSHVVGGSATASTLNVDIGAGQQSTFGGTFGGAGLDENNVGLTKTGAGTLVLNGASTHTGGTVISDGTLQLGASTTMPVNLATLGIWLDGADPDANGIAPADGTPISTWKNKGVLGATGDFSAAAGFEPSYGATGAGLMNGNATIRFTADAVPGFDPQASYDKLTNPIDLGVGPGTIIVAGRYAGASADERKRLVSALNNNWLLGWWNNGENAAYYQNGFAPGTSAPSTNAHVYSAVMRGDGIGETYSESAKLGSLGNAVGPNGLALGGGANYATQFTENSTGDVGELIIVKGSLDDADRAAIEAYLARKWAGFLPTNPLPTTGPVTLANSGVTLAVNGVTQTVGSVTGVVGSSITLGGGSFTAGNDGLAATFDGVVSGTGTLGKSGFGTWTLTAAHTYNGTTAIKDGTLELSGGANRLPTNTVVTLGDAATAGTLRLNGNHQTIGGLTTPATIAALGSHVVNGSATPATLTVNLASGTNNYGGAIGGSGTDEDNIGLRKEGAGTLALTNTSTHTGGTVIAAGTIRLGGPRTLPVPAAVWLDATDGPTIEASVDGVMKWYNKGALGTPGDFTAPGGSEPSFVLSEPALNGNPAIHFEAAGGGGAPFDRLANGTDFSGGDVTVAYLGRLTGSSNQRTLSATGNNWLLGTWGGSADSAYFNAGFLHNSGSADTAPRFHVGVIPLGGTASYYSNGVLKGQGPGQGPIGLNIGGGSFGGPTENSSSDVGELLIFDGALSDADRQAVENYIARKWFGFGASDILPAAGAVSLTAAGAVLDVNGVTQTIGALDGVGGTSIELNDGSLTAGDATDTTYAGDIVGGGTFTKAGSGELTLTGALSMTTLIADEGTLNVDSDAAGADVIVNAIANFGVDQTLNSLDITDGAVATVDGPAMAPPPAPFFGGEIGGDALAGAVSVQGVPEPGSVALLFGGMLTLLGLRRRKEGAVGCE